MGERADNGRDDADLRWRWLLSAPALAIVFLASSGPLLVVLFYSFLGPGPYGGVTAELSFDAWIAVILETDMFDGKLSLADAHLGIFWRSVKLSFMTTLLTLLFGFVTAYFMATRPKGQRGLWLLLITIPFWTNLLIRTFAILQLIRNDGIVNGGLIGLGILSAPLQILYTDGAILLGMTYVYLPLMVLPIYASLEKFDFRLVEAGYDLYANSFQVLWQVILPLVKPGIIAGSILVFIPSLGAYVTPNLLGGGKNMMLSNLIELQFGPGHNWPLGAALSISVMAIVMVALLVYVRNVGRTAAKHG